MTSSAPVVEDLGSLCFVLHTHLPYVAHHGTWPVGEEWLHQAWSHSYLPVVDLLNRLAEDGRRDVLSLGITPILAAQLDDPYCLRSQHSWLGDWQARAAGLAGMREPYRREAGGREYPAATRALEQFESQWSRGASPILRRLSESGVVEILGGPLTHTFTPALEDQWARATLSAGLDDARLRIGQAPSGIWTPECAYRPGLDDVFHAAGVSHLMLEGPTLLSAGATTDRPWLLGDTQVRVVGRDLPLAYRVWSPRRGYPGGRWYRDFHTYDHEWGFRLHRVTGKAIPPESKAPYEPARAQESIVRDAHDFVSAVRGRLLEQRARNGGRPGMAVVAYDTELFGHWWHEGPLWLEEVLRQLPTAGVTPRSMSRALEQHDVTGRVHPDEGSWGSGKDFRVWTSQNTTDLRDSQERATRRVRDELENLDPLVRHHRADQLTTSLLLGLASDWIFMVEKDSAADYARARLRDHLSDVDRILNDPSDKTWRDIAERDRPYGHVDARAFLTPSR